MSIHSVIPGSGAARAASHVPAGALSDTARQVMDKATDMGTLNPGRLAEDLARRPAAERQQMLQELGPHLSPRDADSLMQELAARGTPADEASAAKPKADEVDVGELALDLTQIGLDIVGIFDPTPISDGSNALISLFRGDFLGAGLSAVSMIPYVGDAAKLGKLGKYAQTVAKAVDAAKANPALAEKLAPALKKISEAIEQLPLDKLPNAVREGIAPIKGKLDEFARIGVREVSTQVGRNHITWTQNAAGETIAAKARLGEVFSGATRSPAEKTAQRNAGHAGLADDVGGHIIGHRFVKDQGAINMFPQNTQFNNGAFRTMENDWARWIKKGGTVEVDIKMIGDSARPDKVEVKYRLFDSNGNRVDSFFQAFKNEVGQNYSRRVY